MKSTPSNKSKEQTQINSKATTNQIDINKITKKIEVQREISLHKNLPLNRCTICARVPSFYIETATTVRICCDNCRTERVVEIDKYLEHINIERKKEYPNCSNEKHKSKKSSMFCINCKKWLCSECAEYHDMFASNHSITFHDVILNLKCPIHDESFTHYCYICKKNVCRLCYKTHALHSIKYSDIINDDLALQLNSDFKKVSSNVVTKNMKIKVALKEGIVEEIKKLNELINKLDSDEEKSYNTNLSLIKFLWTILDNYNSTRGTPTFNIFQNANNNLLFNLNSFNINLRKSFSENAHDFLKYLDNFYIIDFMQIKQKFKDNKINAIKKQGNVTDLKLLKEIKIHKEMIYSIYYSPTKSLLFSGSADKTIKIYDEAFLCFLSFQAHSDIITSINELENGKIISSSLDNTVKIWTIDKSEVKCDTVLKGHSNWVFKCIPLKGNKIASCSHDKTIKIWKGEKKYDLLQTIEKHKNAVQSMAQLQDERLVSIGLDNVVYFWDLKQKNNVPTNFILNVPCGKSYCGNNIILYGNCKMLIGGNNIVTAIDYIKYEVIKTFKLEEGYIDSIILLPDSSFLIGCEKHLVQLKPDFSHLFLANGAISIITPINEHCFASNASRNTIKIWLW